MPGCSSGGSCGGLNRPGSLEVVKGLLKVLPEDELPGFRIEAAKGAMVSGPGLDSLLPEYFAAVDRRLR